MNESTALSKMVPPGRPRVGKPWNGGVIQILLTSSCSMACYGCTQNSQLARPKWFMSLEQFEQAVLSLEGYFGLRALFGGQPTLHPQFPEICKILRKHVPIEKRGLWTNALNGHGAVCRETFLPSCTNLNVHLSQRDFDEFARDWPEAKPFGLHEDSRHSPPFVAMRDVLKKDCDECKGSGTTTEYAPDSMGVHCQTCAGTGKVYDEERAWELVSNCPINVHWSASIGVFRGQLRAWFCELAMAQSILHQDEPDYPDTGIPIDVWQESDGSTKVDNCWWRYGMTDFAHQVRKHCHECSIPLNSYGELAQSSSQESREQVSATHATNYKPKRQGRKVEVVTDLVQLGLGRINHATEYLQNAKK